MHKGLCVVGRPQGYAPTMIRGRFESSFSSVGTHLCGRPGLLFAPHILKEHPRTEHIFYAGEDCPDGRQNDQYI